jgi:transposase
LVVQKTKAREEGADMWIIGCDYHPSFQQIAFVDQTTGEYGDLRLEHKGGEAEKFYRSLTGQQVRVGVEATGGMRWFERLLGELGIELWVGDPARIRAAAARKPKTDKEDARLLQRLLLEKRFPRIWVPTVQQRDARQLVLHRHRLVQTRTRAKNQLQDMARNEGLHPKRRVSCGRASGAWFLSCSPPSLEPSPQCRPFWRLNLCHQCLSAVRFFRTH